MTGERLIAVQVWQGGGTAPATLDRLLTAIDEAVEQMIASGACYGDLSLKLPAVARPAIEKLCPVRDPQRAFAASYRGIAVTGWTDGDLLSFELIHSVRIS